MRWIQGWLRSTVPSQGPVLRLFLAMPDGNPRAGRLDGASQRQVELPTNIESHCARCIVSVYIACEPVDSRNSNNTLRLPRVSILIFPTAAPHYAGRRQASKTPASKIGKHFFEAADLLLVDAIACALSHHLGVDEPCFSEDFQMLGDRRLSQRNPSCEVTEHAGLVDQELQDAHSYGLSKRAAIHRQPSVCSLLLAGLTTRLRLPTTSRG